MGPTSACVRVFIVCVRVSVRGEENRRSCLLINNFRFLFLWHWNQIIHSRPTLHCIACCWTQSATHFNFIALCSEPLFTFLNAMYDGDHGSPQIPFIFIFGIAAASWKRYGSPWIENSLSFAFSSSELSFSYTGCQSRLESPIRRILVFLQVL